MNIKVLDPCYDRFYYSFRQFFDLNGDDYILISDKDHGDPVDILVCNHFYHPGLDSAEIIKKYNYRCAIFLDIKHNSEDQIAHWNKIAQNSLHQCTITNAIDLDINNPSIVFNDFLFNRHKAYYQGFQWSKDTVLWYFESEQDYALPDIPNSSEHKTKIFVAPNHTVQDSGRQKYRKKLISWLKHNYINKGYLGAAGLDSRLFLYPQSTYPDAKTVQELLQQGKNQYIHKGFSPPHDVYYQDSFVSIYAETIEYGRSYAVTEKTFDPMIKGHFVLPFSNPGFVDFLQKNYAFKLPNFIDYAYDSIWDDDARFEAYLKEADRLINLSLPDWVRYWNYNKSILEHNQRVFLDRPYHRINLDQFL